MISIRAVYRDGKLNLLEDVNLEDGQEVRVQITEPDSSLSDLIGDMLVSSLSQADDVVDEIEITKQLDEALAGQKPLSEIIIEERHND